LHAPPFAGIVDSRKGRGMQRFKRGPWRLIVVLSVICGSLVPAIVTNHPAQAAQGESLIHSGADARAINILNIGDSYGAGNGGGYYYDSSPDDPSAAATNYPGHDCYRSWNNSSFKAYMGLNSRGLYINRACSGKKFDDVIPEVNNLVAPFGKRIDLITLSDGGNDVAFKDIVTHCFLAALQDTYDVDTSYGKISKNCYDLLEYMKSLVTPQTGYTYGHVILLQKALITSLLSSNRFANSKLVLSGYPLLVNPTSNETGSDDITANTWQYAYSVLSKYEKSVAAQEQAMVDELNLNPAAGVAFTKGRVAFNNVYKIFLTGGNHGVGGNPPWITKLVLPSYATSYHPNAAGWQQMANGIVTQVNSHGWFANYPKQSHGGWTLNYYPGMLAKNGAFLASTEGGKVRNIQTNGAAALASCAQTTIPTYGWITVASAPDQTALGSHGPDNITVNCSYPRANDVISVASNGKSFVATKASGPSITWAHITTTWMFSCLTGRSGVRRYQGGPIFPIAGADLPGDASCVPATWLNHVLTAHDGSSWFVDGSGYRHHILSTQTFYYLTKKYGAAIKIPVQVDVDTIPVGADQHEQLYAPSYFNTIIRRADGVSWVVDGSGVRHHIPAYTDDLCFQFIRNLRVAETKLSGALAASLPETDAWTCNLDHSVLRGMDKPDPKPSYAYYSGKRHWVPDSWTYGYLTGHGFHVVNVATEAAIKLLPDGGTEPAKLDANVIPRKSIIRRSDGVSWVIDANGWRHHIPYAQDDVCWRDLMGYKVSATGLTDSEAKAFPEGDGWPCIIGWRIVKSNDGASYVVDDTNTRHWIPDTETYGVLVSQGYQVVGPWSAGDVNQIPDGARESYMLNVDPLRNTVICRSDGVCWAVDANGWRHHIPTYADNVCWRWVYGWQVSRNGLNGEQAASLPEGDAWGCSMDNMLMVTDTGAWYYMQGNTRRWIPDGESQYCYIGRGIRGYIYPISQGEANGVPEGGWMPRCLDPNRVKNHIVREGGGTAYFVDGGGGWHWIPDGGVWGCLVYYPPANVYGKYPVLIYDATWEQINSLKPDTAHEGAHANCGM
jgi:hypothetical protein